MDKERFARKLQDIIRDSGIRQTIIAEAMDLSSAAISQFTHGSLLPNPKQLAALLTLLCVDPEERAVMMQALYELRDKYGDTDKENGEINVDSQDDDQKCGLDFETVFSNFMDGDLRNMLIFEEPTVEGTPVITLETLNSYREDMDLHSFATLFPHDLTVRDRGGATDQVVIKANGDQFGLRYHGMVQIVVSENLDAKLSALTLLCLPGKEYRITPAENPEAIIGLESLFYDNVVCDVEPLWTRPIFELSLIPLGNDPAYWGR